MTLPASLAVVELTFLGTEEVRVGAVLFTINWIFCSLCPAWFKAVISRSNVPISKGRPVILPVLLSYVNPEGKPSI